MSTGALSSSEKTAIAKDIVETIDKMLTDSRGRERALAVLNNRLKPLGIRLDLELLTQSAAE